MVLKWVHLTELGGDPWILPIWNAVNEAVRAGKVAPLGKELRELGVRISTRLNFLPRIIYRVNTSVYKLYDVVAQRRPEQEFSQTTEGVAFDVDNNLKYELLVDLDSLLFELNSVCELMGKLFEGLHNHAGQSMPKSGFGHSIRSILQEAGEDPSWFVKLDTNRNFFMHEGTPYVAVDISNAPADYDLIIMKESIKKFDDPSKFIRLSDINDIVQGFRLSRPIVQSYLKSLFGE